MGEVDGHEGVAVVLHVVVHAETSPVVSVNVANCGRGGEGSVSCTGGETQKRVRVQSPQIMRKLSSLSREFSPCGSIS